MSWLFSDKIRTKDYWREDATDFLFFVCTWRGTSEKSHFQYKDAKICVTSGTILFLLQTCEIYANWRQNNTAMHSSAISTPNNQRKHRGYDSLQVVFRENCRFSCWKPLKSTSFHEICQFSEVFSMKIGGFYTDYWKDLCLGGFPSTSCRFHTENCQFSLKSASFHEFRWFSCWKLAVFMKTSSFRWNPLVSLTINKMSFIVVTKYRSFVHNERPNKRPHKPTQPKQPKMCHS